MLRLSVLLLFSLGLAGCFHVQLNGGIAAAEVTVASLERPQEIIARLYSHDPETMVAWKGQAAWDALSASHKALWMGVVFLPAEQLREQDLYLVSARGGDSYDSDMDLVMAEAPVRIRGEWHAIVPGYKFGELRNSVSLLTEACYQWLMFEHDDKLPGRAQILAELDGLAVRMVDDINGDGAVDYSDVLIWNIYSDARHYRGEAEDLQELAMLISLGFPREFIVQASRRIVAMAALPEPPEPRLLGYLRKRLWN
ncbi:MAG: hypothetical protein O7F73_12840 [Gammaproteobacteria bacterium]|nr:hypothetical protein [Gammaproteobacteria bacterium]